MRTDNKALITALSALVLSACSSMPKVTVLSPDSGSQLTVPMGEMYLRGEFSWWDAVEEYRLKPLPNNSYATQVDLIADGQPFKFKFADQNWTMGANCGVDFEDNIQLDTSYSLNCYTDASQSSFVFKPQSSGSYRFILEVKTSGPTLTITKA